MAFIQFDLQALNVAGDLARAAGLNESEAIAGLVRMWAACFRAKADTATGDLLLGWFGAPDTDRVARALVAQGFLEPRGDGWRVRGTSRYTVLAEARRAGGLAARGNLLRGRTRPAEAGVQPEVEPGGGRRCLPAEAPADPRSEIRDPRSTASTAVPVEPPAAPPPPAPKPRQRAQTPARETSGAGELVLEAQTPHEPDRARQALIDAAGRLFQEVRGKTYSHPSRDFAALKRLRERHSDGEILRRFGHGLRASYGQRVSTLWETEQKWDANATPERGSAATAPLVDENGDCALCKARLGEGQEHLAKCQYGRQTG